MKNKHSATLLDPGKKKYYRLNRFGTYLWEICDGSIEAEEMVALIHRAFKVTAAKARRDLLDFLDMMHRERLIDLHRTKLMPNK